MLRPGEAKNTYGTGCFLLMHTGTEPMPSSHGLLTTVAAKLGDQPATYALEGSIAITGALVQWLRDNLGLIKHSAEVEALAQTVPDNGDVYFVPAFSGLYAPYWRADARGTIAGLTRFAAAGHIARAALEATAYQTLDVVRAMEQDSGITTSILRVDGGMVVNRTLMQFQADVLDVPVVRPSCVETTALGAAYAAGLAVGYWNGLGRSAGQLGGGGAMDADDGYHATRGIGQVVAQGGGSVHGVGIRHRPRLACALTPALPNRARQYLTKMRSISTQALAEAQLRALLG